MCLRADLEDLTEYIFPQKRPFILLLIVYIPRKKKQKVREKKRNRFSKTRKEKN